MDITGLGNSYNSMYESNYITQKKNTIKRGNVEENTSTEKVQKEESSKSYLDTLQSKFPNLSLASGNSINWKGNNKTNNVVIHPSILAKMENDEKAAKEYTQRLSDIEAAFRVSDAMAAAKGGTVTFRCDFIDADGQIWGGAIVEFKDPLNEKLRKDAQENAKKRIDESRENLRENKEKLDESIEKDKVEKNEDITSMELLEKKVEDSMNSGNGKVIFDNDEMNLLIEVAKRKGFAANIDIKI